MSVSAKFIADFTSFDRAVDQAETKLKDFQSGAVGVEKALARMGDSFSGRKIVQDATLAAKAVEDIGGASKLTANEQASLNVKLTEALAKFKALGLEAPASLLSLQKETTTQTSLFSGMLAKLGPLGPVIASTFTIGAVVAFGRELLRTADDLVRVADRTGLTTIEVQKLQYIAKQSGNSLDELTGAVGKLQNNLATKDGGAIKAVQLLGLNLTQLRTAAPFDQMEQIATAIGKVPDPAGRAALAMELFGKSGAAILPTLIADFARLGDAAPTMSDKTVRALDQAGDSLGRFKDSVKVWAAESYNFAGRFFDSFVAGIATLVASVLNGTAALLEMAHKLPGVGRAMDALGISSDGVRKQAQHFTDAAKMQALRLDDVEVAVRKTASAFTGLEKEDKKATTATKELTAALLKQKEAAGKITDEFYDMGVVIKGFDILEALGPMPNLAAMSAEKVKVLNKAMNDAIDAAKRNGIEAPMAWYKIAIATDAATRGLDTYVQKTEVVQDAVELLYSHTITVAQDALLVMEKDHATATTRIASEWDRTRGAIADHIRGIGGVFAFNVADMLTGAVSLKDGLSNIWDGIKQAFTNVLGEMLQHFIQGFINKMLAAVAGSKIGQAITGALGGGGGAAAAGGGVVSAGGGAAVAAGAIASLAIIPAVGLLVNALGPHWTPEEARVANMEFAQMVSDNADYRDALTEQAGYTNPFGWQTYHAGGRVRPLGLASDEVPAVLQTGEMVLDRHAAAGYGRSGNADVVAAIESLRDGQRDDLARLMRGLPNQLVAALMARPA